MLILIPVGWLLAVGVGLTLDPSLIGWSLLYSLPTLVLPLVSKVSADKAVDVMTHDQARRILLNDKTVMSEPVVVQFVLWSLLKGASTLIAAACPLAVLWQLGGAS